MKTFNSFQSAFGNLVIPTMAEAPTIQEPIQEPEMAKANPHSFPLDVDPNQDVELRIDDNMAVPWTNSCHAPSKMGTTPFVSLDKNHARAAGELVNRGSGKPAKKHRKNKDIAIAKHNAKARAEYYRNKAQQYQDRMSGVVGKKIISTTIINTNDMIATMAAMDW